jgi:hypothetical protein
MERVAAVRVLALVLMTGGLAGPAAGEPGEAVQESDREVEWENDFHRWTPGISLGFDVLMQNIHGSMETNFSRRLTRDIGVEGRGESFMMSPMFGGDIQLTAPSWTSLPGRPRLYAGVGLRYVQQVPHTIASSGDKPGDIPPESQYFPFDTFRNRNGQPARPVYINGKVNPACDPCKQEIVGGQGIGLTAQAGHFYWDLELGVVFTVPVGERDLLIKPGVGYNHQEIQMIGVAHRVYRDSQQPRAFYETELDITVQDTFHSLGATIAFELDVLRFSQLSQRFGASVFFDAGAYWMLGDRGTTALVEETAPFGRPPHTTPDTAFYRMEVDQMSYRLGVGMKLSWYPR